MTLLAQSQIAGPDLAMLIGYFVLMLGIGAYFYRHMKGMKDFFSGGNTIPWWLSGASFFMSSFSVFAFVSYSALAYRYGWVAVTIYWVTVPATIFSVVLFAKKWRRARIDSPVEYLETRYSFGLRQLFTWQGVPVIVIDDALKLIAIGGFIATSMSLPRVESFSLLGIDVPLAALGLSEPIQYTMAATALIMLLYTLMGGLWAVTVTDFIQFVVMSVGVLVVLPLSISRAGGMGEFLNNAPEGFFNLVNAEFNWIYIVLLTLLYCLAWSSVKWPLIQRYYCVRDEKEAMKVGWFVVFLNVVVPPLMFLPAIAAQQFMGDVPDQDVYPRLCLMLLPAGMLGLVVAAMFSATMSMLSSDYNACAGVLTNDVYRRLIRKNASQKELVSVGRLMTLLIGVFALVVALGFGGTSGVDLFRYMVTLFSIATAPVAVPMLMGILSKKFTNRSATVGFFCGLTVGLGMFLCFYGLWGIGGLPESKTTPLFAGLAWSPENDEILFGDMRLKMEVVLFTANAAAAFLGMLVTTLIWPMQDEERRQAEEFHQRLQTPIGELEEDKISAGGTAAISPFGVVGVSIILIGLMMLGVLPWVWASGVLPFALDLGFGAALLVVGAVMIRGAGRSEPEGDVDQPEVTDGE